MHVQRILDLKAVLLRSWKRRKSFLVFIFNLINFYSVNATHALFFEDKMKIDMFEKFFLFVLLEQYSRYKGQL